MPRKKRDNPQPKLLRHRAGWRVVWWRGKSQYAVGVAQEAVAKAMLARLTVALITDQWDADLAAMPAVRRWRGRNAPATPATSANLVEEFCATHSGVAPSRVKRYRTVLTRLREFTGAPLDEVTPTQAAAWLAQAKAPATRNLHLVILKMFYRWAGRAHGWVVNPVAELRQSKAARANTDIQYLSKKERDEVLAAADEIAHGIAVWLALLAGLRENEVWRLEWSAVNLQAGTLVAQSKRGRVRTVPLEKRLAKKLAGMKQSVLPVVGTRGINQPRRTLARLARALKRRGSKVPPELLKWNVFRHTFSALLVQAGVSLDKVCQWCGHTPSVALAHYARFVPKDRRDTDIDRL